MTGGPASAASPLKVGIALATVYLVWGSTYLAIQIAVETLPPFTMVAARYLVAGSVLYAGARFHTGERPTWHHWRSAFLVGGLMFVGGSGLLAWGEQYLPSGFASVVLATIPFFLVLHGWAWGGTGRPPLLVLGGLAVGFAGVVRLVGPEIDGGLGSAGTLAILALAGSAFFWAAGSMYSRITPLPTSSALGTAMGMLAGGVLLVGVAVGVGEPSGVTPASVSLASVAALGYLVVAGCFLGTLLYLWLLRVADPGLVGTYAFVNPVIAVLLGWRLASESVSLEMVASMGVVLAGVAITVYGTGRSRPPAQHGDQPEVGPPAPERQSCSGSETN